MTRIFTRTPPAILLTPLLPLLATVLLLGTSNAIAADAGQYQLMLVRAHENGFIVLRIDTTSGRTWMLDTISHDLVDEEYLKQENYDPSKILQQLPQGYIAVVPSHWKEIPERAKGFSFIHTSK